MATLIHQYLLAETLRKAEEEAGAPQPDPEADKQAIASTLDFEGRILSRAGVLAPRLGVDAAVRQISSAGAGIRLRFF